MHIVVSILLTLLAVIGWTLLALLALLLLVLLMPERVRFELREGVVSLKIYVFGLIGVRLLPRPAKTDDTRRKKKAAKKAKPRAEKAQKRPKPEEGGEKLKLTFDFVLDVLSAAGVLMRRVFRALHFRHIAVVLPIHKDDPAETALACGRAQAGISAGVASLENFLDLRFDGVRILPDFTGDVKTGPYVSFELVVFPAALLLAVILAAARFVGRRSQSGAPLLPKKPAKPGPAPAQG